MKILSMSTQKIALDSLRFDLDELDADKYALEYAKKLLMRAADKADPHSEFAFRELNGVRSTLRKVVTRRAKVIKAITELKRS